eukprot:2133652-Karenia_brevis.AAC.1
MMNKNTSHEWLWRIDQTQGSVLAEEDFTINLQKRMGAVLVESDSVCQRCGQTLDAEMWHSETCACAAATRGHYSVVRALCDGFKESDPN